MAWLDNPVREKVSQQQAKMSETLPPQLLGFPQNTKLHNNNTYANNLMQIYEVSVIAASQSFSSFCRSSSSCVLDSSGTYNSSCPTSIGFLKLGGKGPNEDLQLGHSLSLVFGYGSLHLLLSVAKGKLSGDNWARYLAMEYIAEKQ